MPFDDELRRARTALEERKRLVARFSKNRRERDELRRRRDMLAECVLAEGRDVAKLEGLSLTALFHAILGSKEEQLENERQQLLSEQLDYEAAAQELATAEDELAEVEKKLAACADAPERYEELLESKEAWLKMQGGVAGAALVRIAEEEGELAGRRDEIAEAVRAGKSALRCLDRASECLGRARGWGAWDMLGGCLLTTAFKHSQIDDARAHATRAQAALSRFRRELEDVQAGTDLIVDVGGVAKFADYFFDGLITDWIVQSRIVDSLKAVERARGEVRRLLDQLDRRHDAIETEASALERRRQRIVERG